MSKFSIDWYNQAKSVLVVKYHANVQWEDVFQALMEAIKIIETLSYDVIILHNVGGYRLESPPLIGSIRGRLYGKLPSPPQNIKMIIAVFGNVDRSTRLLQAGLPILDQAMYGRRLSYFVNNLAEAKNLITEAGFELD